MKTRIIGTPFTGEDGKYRYLYLIHNNINQKYYYGIHTSLSVPDSYHGSGSVLKQAYLKYGKENFTKYILEFFPTQDLMMSREEEVVNSSMLEDPYCYNVSLGGLYGNVDRVVVESGEGKFIQVHKNDPRIEAGELTPINTGYVQAKDATGKCYRVKKDDPRLETGELVGVATGFAAMRTLEGDCIKVPKDDPRIATGELVSVVKYTVAIRDSEGKCYRVKRDDPRLETGELHYFTENRITVIDSNGQTSSVFTNDPRLKTGELRSVNKNRIYVHKGGKNKMVYEKDLRQYLENGWERGMIKKGDVIVHKNGHRLLIKSSELSMYLESGWERGQGPTRPKSGRPKNNHSV